MINLQEIYKKLFNNEPLTPEEQLLVEQDKKARKQAECQNKHNMLELNKIHLGDALELLKKIPNNSVDLVYIDPPYEQKVSHGSGAFGVEKKLHYAQFDHISSGFDYEVYFKEFERILKAINIYIWCSKAQVLPILEYWIGKKGCNWQPLRWIKTNPVPACGNKYMNDSEFCLFFRDPGVQVYGTVESKKTFYISQTNKADKAIWKHPTIKPLDCVKSHIFNSTKEGDVVLDCFSGSGTTAVACYQLKRNFIAVEIDEKYHSLSVERLEAEQSQQKLFY